MSRRTPPSAPPRLLRRRGVRIASGIAVAGALLTAGWFGYQHHRAHRVTIEFAAAGNGALPALELTFFPDQLAFLAPSPPPAIGSLAVAAASVTVGDELVPGHAVVKYTAAGFGIGFQHVRSGQPARVPLRAPQTLTGRVVEPIGAWCFGWRCTSLRPVAGAEVIVMGGGEHGVALAAGRTDAEGRFAIDGLDLALDGLGLRVRAAGFAIAHRPLDRGATGVAPPTEPVVPVVRAQPRQGRIRGLANVDPTTLRVLARGLPGVEAEPSADGAFTLDHVPPDTQPRLLLYGLPGLLTHAPVRAGPGELQIDVVLGAGVRGRVVDATTGAPLAEALVFCGDEHAVRSDAHGAFELTRLPPGASDVRAQFDVRAPRRRAVTRSGRQRIQLEAGKVLDQVVISVD